MYYYLAFMDFGTHFGLYRTIHGYMRMIVKVDKPVIVACDL